MDKESLKDIDSQNVAHLEDGRHGGIDVVDAKQAAGVGTVNLVAGSGKDDVVLIPAPSADPRDPLNMPLWRKYLVLIILSIWSCTGNTAVYVQSSIAIFQL